MNVLKPHKKTTIATLLARQISQHEIWHKTGVDRKTIRKYARELGLEPAAAPNSSMATGSAGPDDPIPPPRPPARPGPAVPVPRLARSACEPHREWIAAQVRLGRNAMAIYQELVDQHGFTQRYNSVKRFCRGLKRHEPEQFDRLEFAPGEEAQVDYGEGAPTLDPATGRYRKPRLFVMTLRYSRRSFRKVVWKSSAQVWAQLHEEAFRYFNGCVQYVVLDNLREGVITPDLYEPALNSVYRAMLAHYGVVADPARVRDPNRKGTVESAIQHTQATALKGRRFATIEEQNAFLARWEETWAAQRIHGRAKRQVEEMFQEERPHLRPLPLEGFRYFEDGIRTVQDDTTIQVKGAWYAARPAPIGSQVLVRVYEREIEIRDVQTLALIRRHVRATRPGAVVLPDAERPFNPSRQTQRIFQQAQAIGPQTLALCQKWFEHRGREVQKSLWGVVGLVPRYPASIVEQAAAMAAAHGVTTARGVRAIADQHLAAAVAVLASAPPPPTLTQQHALIRDAAEYAEFFQRHVCREATPVTGDSNR